MFLGVEMQNFDVCFIMFYYFLIFLENVAILRRYLPVASKSSLGIMTPGYPKDYPTKSVCVIAVNQSAAVPIKVATRSPDCWT